AAAAVSDASTFSFVAGGNLTGTVAEVEDLSETQIQAANSITVKDTAQAISEADFSEGNLAYGGVRTITFDASDIQPDRMAIVTVEGLDPVKVMIMPGYGSATIGSAADMAAAVAKALKAQYGAGVIDDQAVTAQNGVVTLSDALELGTA